MVKLVVMSLGAETAPLIYAIYGLSVGLAATSSSHSALEGNRQVENMPQRRSEERRVGKSVLGV